MMPGGDPLSLGAMKAPKAISASDRKKQAQTGQKIPQVSSMTMRTDALLFLLRPQFLMLKKAPKPCLLPGILTA